MPHRTRHPLPVGLILGHRGSPFEAPENTLASFERALERGADGVELDVQLSADGVPMVIHDPTLERTTHGRGAVADRTREELAFSTSAGEPIPTLEEAARWAVDREAWLNVEIKASGAERATLEALAATGAGDRAILSSFDRATLTRLAELAPEAPRFLLAETWGPEVLDAARETDVRGVCLEVDAATGAALDALGAAGLEVIVWTVDDPGRMTELLRAGVIALITNRPAIVAMVREG